MSIKKIKGNEEVVKRVEEVLQTIYADNAEFNELLNGDEPFVLKSLKDSDEEYRYELSEILFWVDRDTYLNEMEFWESGKLKDIHKETIEYLKETDQAANFVELAAAIRKGRVAPFVGAGLSQPSGYPLWGKALEKLVIRLEGIDLEDIDQYIDDNDYLQAAQVLYDAAPIQVENYIRTEYSPKPGHDGQPAINGAVKLLPKISNGCVITTNFDEVIEEVFRNSGKVLDGYMHGMQMGNNFVQRLLRGDRCILKLHGNALDGNSYVFTKNQYLNAYGDPLDYSKPLPKALRQIFVGHSLLFLGCSLEQDKTLDLFKEVISENDFDIPEHYAVLPKPATAEEKIEKENRLLELHIHPIWYVPDEKHTFIEKLLNLAISINERQIVFG